MRFNKSPKYKRRRRIFFLVVLGILALNTFFLVKAIKNYTSSKSKKKEPITANKKLSTKKAPSKDKKSNILLSFAGDCTLGTDTSFGFQNSMPAIFQQHGNDPSYFFKNVKSIFESDDASIVNLETTFTNSNVKTPKKFNFKGDSRYAKSLTLGNIDAVNISNNHIYDYGTKGFEDTKNTLKQNKIPYFGEGNKYIKEIKGIQIGFLGYTGFDSSNSKLNSIKNDINYLKNDKKCDLVIINFHWGSEGTYHPIETQKTLAHFSIDKGADLIIGHHPHVVQGLEKYKNKIIAYSLGNFCFGGNFNPKDKDTYIFQINYSFNNKSLESQKIKIIPCKISSTNNINNYCPTPQQNGEKTRILNKVNSLSTKLPNKLSNDFINIDVKK
ncbi:CapA family protein [Clostridium oceanicum]|uniref:CapA family protein n=1 Tax=Clostridium oceanicum TaxID=1543 RepID=A0ABN1JRB0_9CLOT